MITRYVNTNSTAGGNGTTNATTGADRAYVSLSEFESQEQGTMTDNITVHCSGGQDSTEVVFSGWTFGSYKIIVRGNQVGGKKLQTDKYRIRTTGTNISIDQSNATIEFWNLGSSLSSSTSGITMIIKSGNSDVSVKVYNSVFTSSATGTQASSVRNDGTTSTLDCFNCLWHDGAAGIRSSVRAYNCVFINMGRASHGATLTKNCIFQDNSEDGAQSASSSNNLTDKASLGGTDNVVNTTLTFKDKSGGDFRLAAGDTAAMGAGVGPSLDADVYTEDVDGDLRSGTTCDIGLDEYIAGFKYSWIVTMP
jgi:hypothetical protein